MGVRRIGPFRDLFQLRGGRRRRVAHTERRYGACFSVIRHPDAQEGREAPEYGFTLIELLIVIVVIGILAVIVVFSLTGVTGQSKAAACTSDGKTVEIAADAYQAKNGSYPADVNSLVSTYITAAPGTGNGYVVSLGSDRDVSIGGGAATPYNSVGGCSTLG